MELKEVKVAVFVCLLILLLLLLRVFLFKTSHILLVFALEQLQVVDAEAQNAAGQTGVHDQDSLRIVFVPTGLRPNPVLAPHALPIDPKVEAHEGSALAREALERRVCTCVLHLVRVVAVRLVCVQPSLDQKLCTNNKSVVVVFAFIPLAPLCASSLVVVYSGVFRQATISDSPACIRVSSSRSSEIGGRCSGLRAQHLVMSAFMAAGIPSGRLGRTLSFAAFLNI